MVRRFILQIRDWLVQSQLLGPAVRIKKASKVFFVTETKRVITWIEPISGVENKPLFYLAAVEV